MSKESFGSSSPFVIVEGLPHTHKNHTGDRSRVSNALEEALSHQDLFNNLPHVKKEQDNSRTEGETLG